MQTGHKPERPLILVVVYQKYFKDFIWPPRSSLKDFIWHLPQSHQPEVPFSGKSWGSETTTSATLSFKRSLRISHYAIISIREFNLHTCLNCNSANFDEAAKLCKASDDDYSCGDCLSCKIFRKTVSLLTFMTLILRKHNQDYAAVLKCTQWLLIKATIPAYTTTR